MQYPDAEERIAKQKKVAPLCRERDRLHDEFQRLNEINPDSNDAKKAFKAYEEAQKKVWKVLNDFKR